jgi:ATP-dependent Zn protease
MAQKTDEYIKSLLDERYKIVKAKLKEYSEVIEKIKS